MQLLHRPQSAAPGQAWKLAGISRMRRDGIVRPIAVLISASISDDEVELQTEQKRFKIYQGLNWFTNAFTLKKDTNDSALKVVEKK